MHEPVISHFFQPPCHFKRSLNEDYLYSRNAKPNHDRKSSSLRREMGWLFSSCACADTYLISLVFLSSGKWECPWHQCAICGNPATSFCEFCPHSYCKDHEKGALVSSALDGRLCCSEHNPKAPVAPEYWGKIKRRLEQQNPEEASKE